jgi:hypothetical protein
MELIAPDLAHFWLSGQVPVAVDAKSKARETEAGLQQAALAELADRVTAARTIV